VGGFGHDTHLLTYWWTALAISAVSALLGVARLTLWPQPGRGWAILKGVFLIVLAGVFVEDLTSEWSTPAERAQRLGLQLGMAGTVWLIVGHVNKRREPWRAYLLSATLLVAGLGSLGWHVRRAEDHPSFSAPFDLEVGTAELLEARLGEGAVQTGAPDDQVNCHGWTFAGGRRSLNSDDVARILEQDDWQAVEDPAAGDVVVYHDDYGGVFHSGRVKARRSDGVVLVESKWGELGRFVHPVGVERFPSKHTYYHRSGRRMPE
jgi:hypothetical protein